MKKVSWLLVLGILLCACAAAPAAPNFSDVDFAADVAFTLGGRAYAARYAKSGETETLAFTAPENLCGMRAAREKNGAVTITVGDLTYAAEAAGGMFAFAALFAPPDGCLRFVSETDGVRCFSGSDGADSYTMYTDESGLPLRLCGVLGGREYDIQILSFDERSDPQ